MKETLKKELKEWMDLSWLWGSMLLIIGVVFACLYYKSHYCKEIPYDTTCSECIEWKEVTNGYQGKYKRTWEECVEYRYYDCVKTYDSCGCNKIK